MAHRMFCRRTLCVFLFLIVLAVPCFAVTYYQVNGTQITVPVFSDNSTNAYTILAPSWDDRGSGSGYYPATPGVSSWRGYWSALSLSYITGEAVPDYYRFQDLNGVKALFSAGATVTLPTSDFAFAFNHQYALFLGVSQSLPDWDLSWTRSGLSTPLMSSATGAITFSNVGANGAFYRVICKIGSSASGASAIPSQISYSITGSPHYLHYVSIVDVTDWGSDFEAVLDAIQALSSVLHADITSVVNSVSSFAATNHSDLSAILSSLSSFASNNHDDLVTILSAVRSFASQTHTDFLSLVAALNSFASTNHTDLAAILAAFNREFPALSGVTTKSVLQAILTALTTDSSGVSDSANSAIDSFNSAASDVEDIEDSLLGGASSGVVSLDDALKSLQLNFEVDLFGSGAGATATIRTLGANLYSSLGGFAIIFSFMLLSGISLAFLRRLF